MKAKDTIDQITSIIQENLSMDVINEIAMATGFVQRKRDFDAGAALHVMLELFATGQIIGISDFYRSYKNKTKIEISKSAFYQKLQSPNFAKFCLTLYERCLDNLYADRSHLIRPLLGKFDDVLIQDGSSQTLNNVLDVVFPGRFTKTAPAAIELHTLYSLKYGQYIQVALAPDSQSEHDFMPNPKDVDLKNKLSIFDAGYWNPKKLDLIRRKGGFFLVRGKQNLDPKVISVNPDSYNVNLIFNKRLQDVLYSAKNKKNYDLMVEVTSYGKRYRMRCLLIWNKVTKTHVIFFTNVPVELLSMEAVAAIYRLRWQVELTYKELKSHTGLHKLETKNEHIVEGYVWASLLAGLFRNFLVISAEMVLGVGRLSTHKVAISARDYFYKFTNCALNIFRKLKKVIKEIFDIFKDTMKISNPHRKDAFQKCNAILQRELSKGKAA